MYKFNDKDVAKKAINMNFIPKIKTRNIKNSAGAVLAI